jgi:import inner membrane translocase subunit TIM13
MTDKCFTKCITKPGADLSNSERACLAKCMDRYMEAWNHVMKVYATRLQRDQDRG